MVGAACAFYKSSEVHIATTRTIILYPLRVSKSRHSGVPRYSSVPSAGGQHGTRPRPQPEIQARQ